MTAEGPSPYEFTIEEVLEDYDALIRNHGQEYAIQRAIVLGAEWVESVRRFMGLDHVLPMSELIERSTGRSDLPWAPDALMGICKATQNHHHSTPHENSLGFCVADSSSGRFVFKATEPLSLLRMSALQGEDGSILGRADKGWHELEAFRGEICLLRSTDWSFQVYAFDSVRPADEVFSWCLEREFRVSAPHARSGLYSRPVKHGDTLWSGLYSRPVKHGDALWRCLPLLARLRKALKAKVDASREEQDMLLAMERLIPSRDYHQGDVSLAIQTSLDSLNSYLPNWADRVLAFEAERGWTWGQEWWSEPHP